MALGLYCKRYELDYKKRWGRKPVSVFKSAIYLRDLPPGIGRAALICQYIWFCRPWCRARRLSPTRRRELLPHVFTLALRRLFSVTAARDLSRLGFPQQGALTCPDFPHHGTNPKARRIAPPV